MKITELKKKKRSNFGMYIRITRVKKGITATQLAARLGCSRATIYNYESGVYLPIKKLEVLAGALEIPFNELYKIYLES